MGRWPAPLAASRIALLWFLTQAALLSLFVSWKVVLPSIAVLGQDSDTLHPGNLQALLAIRDSLSDPHGALQSWNGTGVGACQDLWAGVKCVKGEVTILQLAGLGLGGNLSDQVGQLTNLRKLNIHSNAIQGPIPATFGSLRFLRAVYLHSNQFTGEIPQALGSSPLLQRVDVSSNQLTGQVPQGLAMSTRLLFINISDNMLSGPVPEDWAQNPSVEVLGAARNQLSGPLPERWTASRLQILDLVGNSLNGSIPTGLGNLTSLTYLDLSRNHFSGAIPDSLKRLPNLSTFNVSSNELDGPIPTLAQTFPSSSFAGNPGLCGKELALRSCSGKKKNLSALAWVGIALGIAIFTVAAACICLLIVWRIRGRKRGAGIISGKRPEESPGSEGDVGGKLVHFDGPLAFTVDDLLRATAEVLGKSSYGTVYKATLEDGNSVAVKRLREGIVKGQREFEAEIESLGALRHQNLLSLRAYYWGPKGEKLLVYDFMPLGSLAAFLHGSRGPQTPLGWQTRLRIATGTARGLAYLHLKEKIVHGNLTSSNILLDRHMSPQISDYGLSRVMTTSANSTVIATAGALGYRAPELTKLKKATFKSDVYSFGVILLELLTGKAPSDTMTGNSLQSIETSLPEWVASVVKEEWTNEVFDVDLMKDAPADDELLSALQLAMSCVVASPAARPEMDEVVLHLEEITPLPPPAQQPLRHDL